MFDLNCVDNLLTFISNCSDDFLAANLNSPLCIYNFSVIGTNSLLGIEDSVLCSPDRPMGVDAGNNLIKNLLNIADASSVMFYHPPQKLHTQHGYPR